MSAAPRRGLGKKLGMLAVSLVLATGLLEGVVRVRHWMRSGSFQRAHSFVHDEATGLTIPTPERRGSVRTDSRGFRSPEVAVPKPDGRVRIAFLGGSTTFCAEASSNEATWPALVVEALRAAYRGADLDWINASIGGYAVDGSIDNFRLRVRPLDPDVVVVYHATNDIAKDTREVARAAGIYTGHADRDSWLASWSMAYFLIEKNLLFRARRAGAGSMEGKLELRPGLADAFHARLGQLVRDCQETAELVVLVTFAPRVRREQSPERLLDAASSSLYYMPYMTPDAVLRAFEAYNRVIRAVAAETGALLVEGELDIPADAEHYADSVHLTDAGCRAMARRVAPPLIESEVLRHLAQ